jgi:uncharacterized membrane protein
MFIDNLALTEGFLLFAAAILTYMGVLAWWGMHKNRPDEVRHALRGAAIPAGGVGLAAVVLGIWSEISWPYPATMGGYNILFDDVSLVFGLVLVTFAAVAYLNLRLQYVGVFAFVAGAVTIFYGWTAYGFGYTKEPLDFLLLYAGFGVAGIVALPVTVTVDHYLGTVAASDLHWRTTSASAGFGRRSFGNRAVQQLGLTDRGAPDGASDATVVQEIRYRMPAYAHAIVLLFPIFMALAGIAAMWFLGTTLPGHLTPGKTP